MLKKKKKIVLLKDTGSYIYHPKAIIFPIFKKTPNSQPLDTSETFRYTYTWSLWGQIRNISHITTPFPSTKNNLSNEVQTVLYINRHAYTISRVLGFTRRHFLSIRTLNLHSNETLTPQSWGNLFFLFYDSHNAIFACFWIICYNVKF